MNRKICYLILLLVQILGAIFQVCMLLSGEPGNGENPPIIWLSIIQILLWLAVATTDPLFCLAVDVLLGTFFWVKRPKDTRENSF